MASAQRSRGGWRKRAAWSAFSTWMPRAARKVAGEIKAKGGKVSFHATDISDYDTVKRAVEAFEAASGPVSFLVNNCRLGPRRKFPGYQSGVLAENCRHQSLRPVERQPHRDEGHGGARFGRVVNIAFGCRPGRLVGRGGLFGLQGRHDRVCQDDGTRACEQGRHRQHALPGPDRHRDPAKLPGGSRRRQDRGGAEARDPDAAARSPEDYPGLVAFFLSDDAAYITGQTISVSGGLTMHG